MIDINWYPAELYFPGPVYSFKWIEESIWRGKLLPCIDYKLFKVKASKAGKHIDFNSTWPLYSIWEALSLFTLIESE